MLPCAPSLSPAEPDWAAFAAIDWASRKHAWSLVPVNGGPPESGTLDNTPEAVELWAMALHRRFAARPIAISIEQKRGAVIYLLAKYAHFVLYPVPPSMAASYRQAFFPSGAKNDPGDAGLLLEILLHHRQRLRPRHLDTPPTRLLQFLVEQRRQLVQQKVQQVQRLTDCLQQYFPQLRLWFDSLDSPLVAALLDRWPVLPQLQRAHPGTLHRFFVEHNCRREELIQQRIQAIYAAVAAIDDAVVIEACTCKTQTLLHLIRCLQQEIAALEKRIRTLTEEHPDAPIFASFPGAGPATVPRLIAAFGTCRDAYANAGDLQRVSGVAPVGIISGNAKSTRMRRACPKFLRQTFHEFAAQSIPYSAWAKAYYQHHVQQNKSKHHAAVRSLANKWIRILYRCWKDHRLYDESIFLESQRRRGALLGADLAPLAGVQWQSEAGFQKVQKKQS
jgi:transposase